MDSVLEATSANARFTRKLMAAMLGETDPMFLRGFFWQASLVTGTLSGMKNRLFDWLNEIGSPITTEIMQAFANLAE
jgi:hypothetical protein